MQDSLIKHKDPNNMLADYRNFDHHDVLNNLYIVDEMRESGHEDQAKAAFNEFNRHGAPFQIEDRNIRDYLNYIMELGYDEKITVTENTDKSKPKSKLDQKLVTMDDTDKLVRAIVIEDVMKSIGYRAYLTYDELGKILDLSHGRERTLTREEYGIFAEVAGEDNRVVVNKTKEIVKQNPIPNVAQVRNIHATDELPDLFDEYRKDDYFSSRYRIQNIYAIAPNEQSKNAHKNGKNEIVLNSGTSNESLVKILSGGFKKPSQLAKEHGVRMMGQMYGDAVYFARPNQISKNTAYVDHKNRGSKFIVVAAVHYDREVSAKGDRAWDYKYDGRTMLHAHNVGSYDRDEYMVTPKQVEIKYVLEVVHAHKHSFKTQKFPPAQESTLQKERTRIANLLNHLDENGNEYESNEIELDLSGLDLDELVQ